MKCVSCATAAAVATLYLTANALAQSNPAYPVKAVRIVVPVAPGGGTDPQTRRLGRKFQESMGQVFVIENRTGAASMISTEIASAIKFPDVREFMAREGAEPVGSTPQEFAMFFKGEVERYAKVIQAANIRVE